MSTIITINASDQITNSRADINTNFSNLNTDKFEASNVDTDTSMAANSDAKVPSQKAVKTYIDTQGGANASETARGVVEEATDAEVSSGSATGATGAKLFLTPTKLLSSKHSATKSVTAGATINGATLPVPVYQKKTDNEFYACDANDTAATKFLGFAVSNGTDGAAMTVQFNGVVPGFSALDEGEKYYVSDTVGTISTTPGTLEILVGVAISTTELLIMRGQRYANGGTTYSDAGGVGQAQTTAVVTGFRPSLIRMSGFYNNDTSYSESTGSWCNGIYNVVSVASDESGAVSAVQSSTTFCVYIMDTGASSIWEVTITSVTDTGFTVNVVQQVASPKVLGITWEVIGQF